MAGKAAPAAAGDVLYGLRGYIPASNLNEEGAAYTAAAKELPSVASAQGLAQIGKVQQAQRTTDQGFAGELAKLAGTVPAVRRTIANDLANQKYKKAELGIATQRLADSEANTAFNQKETVARYNLEASKFAQQQFQQDRMYQVSLARLGVTKRSLQLRVAANAFKEANGGYTQQQLGKLQEQANGLANDAFHGSTSTTTVNGVAKTTQRSGLAYFPALGQMMKKGIPVQTALDALDRVYPTAARPTAAALQTYLGPLAPTAITEASALAKSPKGAPQAPAGYAQNTYGKAPSSPANPAGYLGAGGFLPTSAKFSYGRADQGRDIQTAAGTPIIAPGSGFVVDIKSDPGSGGAHFGPSYPVVHFTSGPYAGQTIYIGHTVAALKAGQAFHAGAVLSHTQASGPLNGGAPDGWAEIGFAPGGTPGRFGQQVPF